MINGASPQQQSQPLVGAKNQLTGGARAMKALLSAPGRSSPARVLILTIAGIALAEVIAMIVVYYFKDWSYAWQVLLDATIMTLIITPLLYFVLFKPLLQQIQQKAESESIQQARLRMMQYANSHTLDELLQFILDEIETLTGSMIGFFHFLESDQKTIQLTAWSSNTLRRMCVAEGKGSHYDLDQAGVWADAARNLEPVIHNSYAALAHRKGLPEGHVEVIRELVVPVLRQDSVVAILGVGNKPQIYSAADVRLVTTLADFAWDVVKHKISESALFASEEKFRTIADWTYDWEKWVDPDGKIVYTSPSCERITGYTPAELIADPALLVRLVHPDDRRLYEEHAALVHQASDNPVCRVEYRIIARDGSEHWIEHICRPLVSSDRGYLGRRISNRDITQRKQDERRISEQNEKEALLTQTIQTIQADIARDLHDTLGQNISYLRMSLELLTSMNSEQARDARPMLQKMTGVADESYELIRSMLSMLQSGYSSDPDKLFLRYADQVAERSEFQIEITGRGRPNQLSPNQVRQLFFIFREALNNIEKHAHAQKVSVEFRWQERSLVFVISDDGRGFDTQATQITGHYGLKFMRERSELMNGTFSLETAPGKGTTITVEIPYEYQLSSLPPAD